MSTRTVAIATVALVSLAIAYFGHRIFTDISTRSALTIQRQALVERHRSLDSAQSNQRATSRDIVLAAVLIERASALGLGVRALPRQRLVEVSGARVGVQEVSLSGPSARVQQLLYDIEHESRFAGVASLRFELEYDRIARTHELVSRAVLYVEPGT